MARALRAQAQRVRLELGARLAGQPVKWTFEVVRGHPASALTAIAAEQDIVVMPAPRPIAGGFRTRAAAGLEIEPLPGPLLVVTTSLRSAQSIAVVPPPGILPQDIVPIFSTLAGLYGRSALFAYAEAEAAHWASWRRYMQALLAAHALRGHFRVVDDSPPGGAVAAAPASSRGSSCRWPGRRHRARRCSPRSRGRRCRAGAAPSSRRDARPPDRRPRRGPTTPVERRQTGACPLRYC